MSSESNIIYVNHAASGSNDGSSWEHAYTDLQAALNEARENSTPGTQIWVAKGVYKPTTGTDRSAAFNLVEGVELYGGFAGNETKLEARNLFLHQVTLSGDIGEEEQFDDNSFHVVRADAGLTNATILDGFTIKSGNANGDTKDNNDRGAGMLCSGSPALRNLTFVGSRARLYGGALYNTASPTLVNVVFGGNRAHDGGAIYNNGKGGTCNPTIVNATFSGNRADGRGGAIYNNGKDGTCNPTLTNLILWGNRSTIRRDPKRADDESKRYSSHQVYNESASITISYSVIEGGVKSVNRATGTNNLDENPRFVRAITPVDAPTDDGDLRLQTNSPALNQGDNNAIPAGVKKDRDGRKRVQNETVNIGAYEQHITFVNHAARGDNNGTSWADAYTDLQDALKAAKDGNEIWVAVGTYKPTNGTGDEARKVSFELVEGVTLYGGFAGDETKYTDRDWNANVTILSGAIGTADDKSGNSYHVVKAGKGISSATLLDGFTITEGNADAENWPDHYAGGMVCNGNYEGNCNPTLRNLIFHDNEGIWCGALYLSAGHRGDCSPLLEYVTFSNNRSARGGGAMANDGRKSGNSNPTLSHVVFSNNCAEDGGGAMYNYAYSGNSSPILNHVIFSNNRAGTHGGAMVNNGQNSGNSSPILNHVTFANNRAETHGGAMYNNGSNSGNSSPMLNHVTFSNNRANEGNEIYDRVRGAISNDEGSDNSSLNTTIIFVNHAAQNDDDTNDGASWTNAYTDLKKALDEANAGDEIWVAQGVYTPTDGTGDEARKISFELKEGVEVYGGFFGTETKRDQRDWEVFKTTLSGKISDSLNSYHVVWGSKGLTDATILDGFIITGGRADDSEAPHNAGGGIYFDGSGSGNKCNPTLCNLIVIGNSATHDGGAMHNDGSNSGVCSPKLVDVKFIDNETTGSGGAMSNFGKNAGNSSPELHRVVFAGNKGGWGGGAIFNSGDNGNSSPRFKEVVFSGNLAERGGAMYNNGINSGNSSPKLIDVTFSGNRSTKSPEGAMQNLGAGQTSHIIMKRVVLWDNTSTPNYCQIASIAAKITISGSVVQGGLDGTGIIGRKAYKVIDDGHNLDIDPDFIETVDPADAPTTTGDPRPQNILGTRPAPFFTIPHHSKYDFGTGAFTIMAMVSPDTLVTDLGEASSDTENTGEIHTGNILAKYDRKGQQNKGGWELSLVNDCPEWAKTQINDLQDESDPEPKAYLSFNIYGKGDASYKLLAPLVSQYVDKPWNNPKPKSKTNDASETNVDPNIEKDNYEKKTSPLVFKRFTHVITVVRESSSTCRLYLNGTKLDVVEDPSGDGALNVDNDEPLHIGKFDPRLEENVQQNGIVRVAALWNKALTQQEVIDQTNEVGEKDPEIGEGGVGYWHLIEMTEDKQKQVETYTNPAPAYGYDTCKEKYEPDSWKDLNPNRNDVPDNQQIKYEYLGTVLPFYMKKQEKSKWCWVATSISVLKFYNPLSKRTQKSYVNIVSIERGWRKPGDPPCGTSDEDKCNQGWSTGLAMIKLGVADKNDSYMTPPLKLDTGIDNPRWDGLEQCCRSHIKNWRPIVQTMKGRVSEHATTIIGFYREGKQEKFIICDPWDGVIITTFDNFKTNYRNWGRWSVCFFTRPALETDNGDE